MAHLRTYFPFVRSSLLASIAVIGVASQVQAFEGGGSIGTGYDITVPEPSVAYPLPVADNYRNQTGKSANGAAVQAYDDKDNPVIRILSGFNRIWTLGDDQWANGGANGDGPTDYSKVKILNPDVWAENMRYVISVTGKNRTDAEALNAYLNDRRSQGYSVIDGLGPLAAWYREGSGATTTINHTLSDFNVNDVITRREDDKGTEAGTDTSELKNFVAFMMAMRGPEATTSPSKYFYSTPRPWRMNAKGEVIQTGTETIGDKTFEQYDSIPDVTVPALRYAREHRGRAKDGGFPSGHTNAAYLAALAYAYAVPERFSELLTKASELGETRIVAGMHSPLDVMGGRITATAIAAAVLQDGRYADVKKAAHDEVQAYFNKRLPQGQTLEEFAHSADKASDAFADGTANRQDYRRRMTYSFSRDATAPRLAMIVPKGAEVLLETRLPYLDASQRRAVLFTTGIESGYPLLDDSDGWGRINLVAAASGYGAFDGDVTVKMDAAAGGLNAKDRWTNDISGAGRLVKSGTGALELAGNNTYSGGVTVEDGTLTAASKTALGTGSVMMSGGTLTLDAADGVIVTGDYTQTGGTLSINDVKVPLQVAGHVNIGDATLRVTFGKDAPVPGTKLPVLSAGTLKGTFASIEDDGGVKLRPIYTGTGVSVIVE